MTHGRRFLRFDVERTWLLVKSLVEDGDARVQWIFAHRNVEALLVEWARARVLFHEPRHPYTRMLLDAIPDLDMTGKARTPVAGEVPSPIHPPPGCPFHPRCPLADDRCRRERPQTRVVDDTHVACHAVEEGRD